jgi:hypothetical protein
VITAAEWTLAEAKAFARGNPNADGHSIDPIDQRAAWQACGIFEVFVSHLRDLRDRGDPN